MTSDEAAAMTGVRVVSGSDPDSGQWDEPGSDAGWILNREPVGFPTHQILLSRVFRIKIAGAGVQLLIQ